MGYAFDRDNTTIMGTNINPYNVTIYSEPLRSGDEHTTSPSPSGSIYSDGLYLADDSADPLSSTLNSSGSLVDLRFNDIAISGTDLSGANRSLFESVGVDLGSSKKITEIRLIDNGDAGAGISWSGSRDSATVYGSTDNSTWVKLKEFNPISRTTFTGAVGSWYQTRFPLYSGSVVYYDYRYFKVYADEGPLISMAGNSLVYTEILTEEYIAGTPVSGSTYNVYESGHLTMPSKKDYLAGRGGDTSGSVGVVIGGGNTGAQRSAS